MLRIYEADARSVAEKAVSNSELSDYITSDSIKPVFNLANCSVVIY